MRTRNPRLEAALTYARRGWPVLPCHNPTPRTTCSCGRSDCASPAKHPRTRHGHRDATTNPALIRTWWRQWPAANVAVATGTTSGLLVIDIDPRHNGHHTLARLIERHGPLPATPTVATGGNGQHLWLAHPGHRVPNDTGRLLGPGIDLRGDGGYVLAPPSRHATGNTYLWAPGTTTPAALPAWLDKLLTPRTDIRRPPQRPNGPTLSTSEWVEHELRRVRTATNGNRNTTLNLAAFNLGRLTQRRDLDVSAAAALLAAEAAGIGLGDHEARRTIDSGLQAGATRGTTRDAAPRTSYVEHSR